MRAAITPVAFLLVMTGQMEPARAGGPSMGTVACEAPRFVIRGDLPEAWMAPIADACRGFAGRNDADLDAVVVFSADRDAILVEVTTTDGREAMRRQSTPQTLGDTLEALLSLPRARRPAQGEPPAPLPAPPTLSPQAAPATPVSPRFAPEIGVGASVRFGTASRHAFGPAAFAVLHVDDWVLGGSIRWDALENRGRNTAPGYEAEAIAAGLTIGRRVVSRLVQLDLAFEPRLIAESQHYEKNGSESGTTVSDFWFAGVARVGFGRGSMRPYVQADVEVAPSRLRRALPGDETVEPYASWTAGIVAGIAWGAP